MPNVNDPRFDEPREQEGFRARRARVGYQLGCERLGMSIWEVPPGQAAYPYHYHLVEEELVVILDGVASLRTPEGYRELTEGDIFCFPVGEQGAHQLLNRSSEVMRFMAISTNGDPDLVLYPDSGKLGAFERLPRGGGIRKMFRITDEVDYYQDEQPPIGQ